jgi:asparagine synthase (glutamine-hydrolysing)
MFPGQQHGDLLMCGICGIVRADPNSIIDPSTLLVMRDSMSRRGPDDAGHFLRPGVGLGSRRLAILDLSQRGKMPMISEDGRYLIVYNGEVYNYKHLRTTLESQGYRFRSNTDTEVVLYSYIEEGPGALERLNGMFAIAIWDSLERTLFLARDRLGVKPLYYAVHERDLYFASEAKALFAAGVPRRFDHSTWDELLCFRYVAGERTPYLGVRRLLPGHYLIWKEGEPRHRRWWNLAELVKRRRSHVPQKFEAWFQETLDDAVALRRISDVPVGVLLSGGLDSSSVAASLASQSDSSLASFTVRFAEPGYDEGPLAKQVADRWNLEYHELQVSPEKLIPLMRAASWFNDEPLVHGNDLHLLAISEYAKPRVTVLLSGEGADETLGGYVRYRPLAFPLLLGAARPVFPKVVSSLNLNGRLGKLSRFLKLPSLQQFVLFNACDVLPEDLERLGARPGASFDYREQVLSEARDVYPRDLTRQAMYSDHHTFLCSILDRNDRMTMAASIECRVPFLDYRLVETLAALPSSVLLSARKNKRLLRESIGARLPNAVLRHRKWGFAVPWSTYFRQERQLRALVERLPELDPIREGPFNHGKIRDAIREFLSGDLSREGLVRQLAMIAVWYQSCFTSPDAGLEAAKVWVV